MTAIPRRSKTDATMSPVLAEARTRLLGWGAAMFAIYFTYVVCYPLIPLRVNPDGTALDLEMMMRGGQEWRAAFYIPGLFALFYAFWQVMRAVHHLSQADPAGARKARAGILAGGVLFGLVLLWLYPITAIDVFIYVVRARLWTVYGQSPMFALPQAFPNDQYMALAGEFAKEVSPYGPLWELVAQIPLRLGAQDMIAGTLAMKLISLISYAFTAWLIGWKARQAHSAFPVSGLTAMTFFAWNPLTLMQAIGNGHNDMLMLALMVLGLVLWQRGHWRWGLLALTAAMLIKITALIILPLYGLAVLHETPSWRERGLRVLQMAAIFFVTCGVIYALTGPMPDVLVGVRHALLDRRGFAPASAARMILRELYPRQWVEPLARTTARDLYVLYFAYLCYKVASGKSQLIPAAYMAYFSQLMLGSTFRIWYPLWLVPLAALYLTSRTFWRTALFGLTAELSIVFYFVLWRWLLRGWEWPKSQIGDLWNYWTIMTLMVVPWVFGIPLIGPMLRKRRNPTRFEQSLWL